MPRAPRWHRSVRLVTPCLRHEAGQASAVHELPLAWPAYIPLALVPTPPDTPPLVTIKHNACPPAPHTTLVGSGALLASCRGHTG